MENRKIAKLVPVAFGAAAVALGFALPTGLAWGFLHPPRRLHGKNPRSALGLDYERVRFRSGDSVTPTERGDPVSPGVTLRGWFVPAPPGTVPRGLVVISHGYYGNRAEMLPYLRFLHAGGYAALLYDFRAHGWSSGMRTTFGIHEVDDLRAAIAWVDARADLRCLPLVLLGESMGASVSLMVAAENKQVRAVVADSAYARFDNAVAGRLRTALGNTLGPAITPSAQRAGERILGVRCADIAPVEAAARIAPRPIFLIHGQEDRFITPMNSHAIHEAALENSMLWEVPKARHVRSVYVAGEEYGERVLAFLADALNRTDDGNDEAQAAFVGVNGRRAVLHPPV